MFYLDPIDYEKLYKDLKQDYDTLFSILESIVRYDDLKFKEIVLRITFSDIVSSRDIKEVLDKVIDRQFERAMKSVKEIFNENFMKDKKDIGG